MAVRYQIAQDDPLAAKLLEMIPIKANELGWFTEDSSLSEYVIMKFLSPKSQEEVAKELEEKLLQPEDKGAPEFSEWLFQIIASYRNEMQGGASSNAQTATAPESGNAPPTSGDMEMDEELSSDIPTGPKSMRIGSRGRRSVIGQISKHLERPSDSVLHRVRNTKGTERINSHSRDPPTGPRGHQNRNGARQPNGRPMGPMGGPQMPMGPGMMGSSGMAITPQQQMQMLQLYEQQARMMAEILTPGQPGFNPALASQMNGGFANGMPTPQGQGRSLFERVQKPHQRHNNNNNTNRRPNNNGAHHQKDHDMTFDSQLANPNDPSSSMEVESSQPNPDDPTSSSPEQQVCHFNLHCTNKDCKYAHQSPAAPAAGVPIDINDKCAFGAACKNKKCVANHPSPAQRSVHQADQECKFYPNCTNAACPFRHPAMPLCRNGADCTRGESCKFTHLTTKCKFSPCMNRACPYKHEEGQRGKFTDRVWTAAGAAETGDQQQQQHLSDRKFVDEMGGEEELIIPGGAGAAGAASGAADGIAAAELVT